MTSFHLASWIAAAMLIPTVTSHRGYSDTFRIVNNTNGCASTIHYFDPLIHKPKYRVGVYTSEGEEAVFRMYNLTFAKYLTMTAGRKFDPPLEFDLLPVTLDDLMHYADEKEVDFFFGSAAVSSCMATEYEAQPLVTIINRREYRGHEYELDMYGGVMFALAENNEINDLNDFKDKIIGAGGLTAMGGGQTQFYEMVKHGMSYVADPKQVVFTVNEALTVDGVLNGEFDIGFARTDQIERHRDENGEILDPDTFKIFNGQRHVLDDGSIFPFLVSTGLHPEWPVAALDHVSKDVSTEVQEALLALRDHYTSLELQQNMRCDTTTEIANLALHAATSGMFTGFRTARSYFGVRTKQEAAGFLRKSEDGVWNCIRGETLYQDIECPEHHYKITEQEFNQACEFAGLPCKEGYECYCKPCVRAFEVDVFQRDSSATAYNSTRATRVGCDKMSLCGFVEQTKVVTFRIVDNRKRLDPQVHVLMHLESEESVLKVHKVPDEPWNYELQWSQQTVGVGIMEIFFDGVQIPESPIRVQVVNRNCAAEYPGHNMVASEDGQCVCGGGSFDVGGKCLGSEIVAVLASIVVVIFAAIAAVLSMRYRNHKNDQMWLINVDELHFDDPLEVIGQGSFGVVLLAEYRGTKVAIKRAIKMGVGGTRGHSSKGSRQEARHSLAKSTDSQDTSDEHTPDFSDLELGLKETNEGKDSTAISGEKTVSDYYLSLDFLKEDYGQISKWAWLFPWLKEKDYHARFKEAILGNSASLSKKSFATRMCPWFNENARREEEFVSEMRVLARLRHPCITTVMGAVMSRSHEPMLVMEYMEYGALHDLLRNETMYLSGEIIMQITRDVAQGLRYLHSSKPPILHGDLKARNILVDSRFRAKLCDFGMSTKKANRITGTPFWLAPEYLRGQCHYNAPCDIYSVGIMFYEIYSRQNPYEGQNARDVLRKICDRRINKRPLIPETCPPKMADLMKKCWSPDPSFRPQARDLDMTLMDMNTQDVEPLEAGQQNQTSKAGKRTGDMLYELFPKHIADALTAGQKVEPEQHDMVTVVFSDIVRFTDIAKEISPLKVSTMLDRLYLAFDKIARKHSVFKVETIGDAYMGVTNLENNQEDTHVKHVAEFAVDMINEASKILIDEEAPHKGYINIRVGFHSGPVVSNVIGSLNPRYGLFGDTVNTASRMESNSRPNRILCSEKSYMLLKEQAPDLPVRKRGKIAVKGKGDMNTFWIGEALVKGKKNATVQKNEAKSVVFEDDSESQYLESFHQDSTHVSPNLNHESFSRESAHVSASNEVASQNMSFPSKSTIASC